MTTVADVLPIREALSVLEAGEPVTHGALTVVPLLATGLAEPDWLTLAEAGDAVSITEVSEGGSVPSLKVANAADRAVLLLDGEELIGAKQNRVLNTTVLVAARSTVTIPVSCVEQGRWHYRSRRFTASDASLYASIRRKKAALVTESLRRGGQHLGDQGEVWSELAGKAADYQVQSETAAMHDVYDRYAEDLHAARSALAVRPGQVGALVFLGGEWVGCEVLAAPGLFARAWPRLCAGYIGDAFGLPGGRPAGATPRAILDLLGATPVEPAPAVGLGAEHRLAGTEVVGAALVAEDRVAHLGAFPAPARR